MTAHAGMYFIFGLVDISSKLPQPMQWPGLTTWHPTADHSAAVIFSTYEEFMTSSLDDVLKVRMLEGHWHWPCKNTELLNLPHWYVFILPLAVWKLHIFDKPNTYSVHIYRLFKLSLLLVVMEEIAVHSGLGALLPPLDPTQLPHQKALMCLWSYGCCNCCCCPPMEEGTPPIHLLNQEIRQHMSLWLWWLDVRHAVTWMRCLGIGLGMQCGWDLVGY